MWKPRLQFIGWHYIYILGVVLVTLIVLAPAGNLSAIQAIFFSFSGSTESGLNVVNLNDLYLYQQIALYLLPIFGNMQVVSILVLAHRKYWYERVLKANADDVLPSKSRDRRPKFEDLKKLEESVESDTSTQLSTDGKEGSRTPVRPIRRLSSIEAASPVLEGLDDQDDAATPQPLRKVRTEAPPNNTGADQLHITFAEPTRRASEPNVAAPVRDGGSMDENRGRHLELPRLARTGTDGRSILAVGQGLRKRVPTDLQRVVTNVFILGDSDPRSGHGNLGRRATSSTRSNRSDSQSRSRSRTRKLSAAERLKLSAQAAIGRNSHFSNLSDEDKDRLGGIEYRSLKLLLKVVVCYYVFLHLFGIICLAPWLFLTSEPKYRNYLETEGINKMWWVIYSSGTMTNNLGFTLTPDSMISFRDSVWPILVMTIQAYAGHTFYPVFLRLTLWVMSQCYGNDHLIQEPLRFLLDHPRRCYTLLFPSRQTWLLAGTLVALNIVDVILIICLDLKTPEILVVPLSPRFMASIFQAASSRHTGTLTFNLANVNPGVQFSLLVMMYVSIFPIALSVRASNTYEESSLGIYDDTAPDDAADSETRTYLKAHIRNQLSFDLWWIFLITFIVCCIEADQIMDGNDPAFQVFPVFFEVASAYGNVGLSLGHPTVATSFCGVWHPASQLILCAAMIRGRHRGLPVRLDRAVMLPRDKFTQEKSNTGRGRLSRPSSKLLPKMKKYYTE